MVGQNSRRSAGNTIAQDSMRLLKVEDASEFLRNSIIRAWGITMNTGYCNLVKSGNIVFSDYGNDYTTHGYQYTIHHAFGMFFLAYFRYVVHILIQ